MPSDLVGFIRDWHIYWLVDSKLAFQGKEVSLYRVNADGHSLALSLTNTCLLSYEIIITYVSLAHD